MEWFFFSYNELYCTVYSVGWNIILTLQWNIAKTETSMKTVRDQIIYLL